MNVESLFWDLYKAAIERDVDKVLERHGLDGNPAHWRPYGQNESNFGVVENQQSSPIPALIEKITNGIDAILMRACIEQGIDPRSEEAPSLDRRSARAFFPRPQELGPAAPKAPARRAAPDPCRRSADGNLTRDL